MFLRKKLPAYAVYELKSAYIYILILTLERKVILSYAICTLWKDELEIKIQW